MRSGVLFLSILALLIVQPLAQEQADAKDISVSEATSNDEPYWYISEYEGEFSLTFPTNEKFYALVSPYDGQGGGYTTEALVLAAFDLEKLDLPDLEFDPEGDAFFIRGTKASLLIVAGIIDCIMTDKVYAENLIAHAEAMGIFE